jgi:hypothetical protein
VYLHHVPIRSRNYTLSSNPQNDTGRERSAKPCAVESAQLEGKRWENMWSPDRTQWWLIWIGFLACSLAAADDALGLAAFLFGVFGLFDLLPRDSTASTTEKEPTCQHV